MLPGFRSLQPPRGRASQPSSPPRPDRADEGTRVSALGRRTAAGRGLRGAPVQVPPLLVEEVQPDEQLRTRLG